MLQKFLEMLSSELEIVPAAKINKEKLCFFRLNEATAIEIRDLDPGISLHAKIGPCPEIKKEELFIFLMRGNLLGQGTGGARIGLDADEKSLTLSIGLPYELDYKSFRESVEEFVNYLTYWRDELEKFEKQEKIL